MQERDRPIELRLSVLDRPRADADDTPHLLSPQLTGRVDASSIRLALVVDDCHLFIARGQDDDEIFQFLMHSSGGGAAGGSRSTLAARGALNGWNSSDTRCIAHGVVSDTVTAVRVDGVEAILANNGFIAIVDGSGGAIALTTADGEREIAPPQPIRALRRTDEPTTRPGGRGYHGVVEYGSSGFLTLEIENLDVPTWRGSASGAVLLSHGTPSPWHVAVVLLEGPRAGELALADMVVERGHDGAPQSVSFVGQMAFAPHPDPPRLEAARRRWDDLARGL